MRTGELRGNQAWVKHLEQKELPVLARTLQAILGIADDEQASLHQLSEVVVQDADLTSSVIKLANSPIYNPVGSPITTVSRAVVQIGFKSVQSIAVSSALVDKLTQVSARDRLLHCIVRSVLAAVFARYLADDFSESAREEVFVATLLSNIGEAAFWASRHAQADNVDNKAGPTWFVEPDLMRQCTGTSFAALSRGLITAWQLGSLALSPFNNENSRAATIVRLALRLGALAVDQKGKICNHTLAATAQGSESVGAVAVSEPGKTESESLLQQVMCLKAVSAAEVTHQLNAHVGKCLLMSEQLGIRQPQRFLFAATPREQRFARSDPAIILSHLSQVSNALATGVCLKDVAKLVVLALQEGLGFSRAGFFMAKPGTEIMLLTAEAHGSASSGELRKQLHISSAHPISAVCTQQDSSPRCLQLTPDKLGFGGAQAGGDYAPQGVKSMEPAHKLTTCLMARLNAGQRSCGFLFADVAGEQAIPAEIVQHFAMLQQQLQLSFTLGQAQARSRAKEGRAG